MSKIIGYFQVTIRPASREGTFGGPDVKAGVVPRELQVWVRTTAGDEYLATEPLPADDSVAVLDYLMERARREIARAMAEEGRGETG